MSEAYPYKTNMVCLPSLSRLGIWGGELHCPKTRKEGPPVVNITTYHLYIYLPNYYRYSICKTLYINIILKHYWEEKKLINEWGSVMLFLYSLNTGPLCSSGTRLPAKHNIGLQNTLLLATLVTVKWTTASNLLKFVHKTFKQNMIQWLNRLLTNK